MSNARRHLGIDYGSKRIGVAVSDPLNIVARGICVIPFSQKAVGEIKRLAEEFDVSTIVVGMPLNLKGEKGQKALEVDRFVELLEVELNATVVKWDERFTTRRVHQTLRELGVKKNKRQVKDTIDEMAAAMILQSYLDSLKHRQALV